MTFRIPNRDQAHAGLRAIKTVLTAEAPLDDVRRTLLDSVQRHLLRTDHDLDALATITPGELAAAIDDPALRAQLVGGMVTIALARDHVEPREIEAVEAFADGLGVHPSEVDQIRRLHEERLVLLRFDVARRGLAGSAMKQVYEQEGVIGTMRNLMSFAGIMENRAVADRYRGLEAYADGTLGKELWRFYKANAFAFPGEKHGGPEGILAHDLSHLLGGYGTDFASEARVLGFQAGYRKQEPFAVLIFLLLQGQHGLKLTPFAEAHHGFFNDKPELVDEVVRAFARGSRMNIDLTDHWDFWAVMDRPIEELRVRYGIGEA